MNRNRSSFSDEVPKESFEAADTLKSEYVIGVRGTVIERESKNKELAMRHRNRGQRFRDLFRIGNASDLYQDDDNVDENLR